MENTCNLSLDQGTINEIYYPSINTKLVSKVKEALLTLLDKGYNIEEIVKMIKETPRKYKHTPSINMFITDEKLIRDFLLSPKIIDLPKSMTIQTKELGIDNPDAIVLTGKRAKVWLSEAWGVASLAQNKFVQDTNREIQSKILKMVLTASQNENAEDVLNTTIKEYFNSNLLWLADFFERQGKSDYSQLIRDNMPFEGKNPNQRILYIIKSISDYFSEYSDSDKMAYTNPKNLNYDKAKAFAKFLLILPLNFDNFLSSNVNSIKIRNKGKLVVDINKYGIQLGKGRQNQTWQDEDSVYTISRMVDDFVLMEIGSWNLYRKQGKIWTKLEDEFCDTTKVIGVLTKILKIADVVSSGFEPIINNLPNAKLINDLKNTFRVAFGINLETKQEVIEEVFTKYIEGKTIPEIIANINLDPHHLLPIIMYLLTELNHSSNKSIIETNTLKSGIILLNDNEVNIIHSIWHNMFDPLNKNSLYNLVPSNREFDLYQMVTQALLTHDKKELYGIVNDMGTVEKKNYSIGKANQKLNYLLSKINGFYSPLLNKQISRTTVTNDFLSDEPSTTISYTPFAKKDTYEIKITKGSKVSLSKNGTLIISNNNVVGSLLTVLLALGDLLDLFENSIKVNFSDDFLNIYINKIGGGQSKALLNLVSISANLIYANEVSKYLTGESTSDFKNKLRNFYNNIPNLVRGVTYNLVDAFSGRMFPKLAELSVANDINEGIIGDIVVKGGAGEQINSVILRTLTTQFSQFVEEKSQDEESAIKHFSIKDAFKRMTFLRDYVDKTGDVKSSTDMNVEEFFLNSFIYDFYGDSLAIHLGVLSDKPNIPKMELYVDTPILVDPVNNIVKPLKDCSAEDLKKVAVRELGYYYFKMKLEMDRNLAILTQYSPLANSTPDFKYDINSDYIETRAFTLKELIKDIHDAIYLALLAGEDIEINEYLYFSWDKNKLLHTKPSLISELKKHDVKINSFRLLTENSELFFKRKEHELVVNLLLDLKHGISFIDSLSLKVIDSSAVRALRQANKDWSTKRHVIIGRVLYGDKSKNLVTKESLTDWKIYKDFIKYAKEVGNFNLDKLNINGNFDFLYFLDLLNSNWDNIQEYSLIESLKRRLKTEVEKKLSSPTVSIDKLALTESYRLWRLDNIEETEIERNQAVLNYATEEDERVWIRRNKAFLTEGIQNITSLEEIELYKKLYNLNDFDTTISKENLTFSLEINPEISRYNTLHYLYSEEGINSTVGSHINHKAPYETNLSLLGAIETGQLAKRNVSESGAKNQYTRGDIEGESKTMTIAVVKDVKAGISTVNGIENPTAAVVMDGSTVGNYVTRKEELHSLGSQKAGIENSKPLGNDLNPKTGTGTIIKTAVFVLTNGRIRSSERNIILHKHMNSIQWDPKFNGDFLHDFNGNEIKYKPVIVYKPSTQAYYLRNNFVINNDGTVSFEELQINNDILKIPVDRGITIGDLIREGKDINPYLNTIAAVIKPKLIGSKLSNTVTTSRAIRTNYELWDLFGGAYSASINDLNELSYENDNTSLDNLTIACHSCGTRLTNNSTRLTEQDVWLPLKLAKIDWVVTEGAIKLGAANINSTEMFTNLNYNVTTLKIATADIGMQLNPEHLVDRSHVTLMTLVVNALGLRGFSADAADKVYQALATLTDFSLQELFLGIELRRNTGDDTKFKEAVSSLLLKSIVGTQETDGDLLSSIVIQLNKLDRNGHDYDIIKHRLPISDPAILNKLISNFSALMTKAGVRIQFPGSMNVLVPSDGIYRIHGGKLRKFASTQRYNNNENLIINEEAEIELLRLQELLALQQPLAGLHAITIGGSYFINLITEEELEPWDELSAKILAGESIKIDDLSTYYKVRDILKGSNYSIIEDVISGRELAPYNCTFNTDKGMYMLWDLDSIKHIHMVENDEAKMLEIYMTYSDEEIAREFHINPQLLNKTDYDSFRESFKRLINRRKQIELNSIGSGNNNSVYIDGQLVKIDKSTLSVSPYELIAPKNYETDFGLRVGDDVQNIVKDKFFFLRRMLKTHYQVDESGHWVDRTPVNSLLYDILLKTISGKSYPILFKADDSVLPDGLLKITDLEFFTRLDWEGSKVYWLDEDGNRLYLIPYHLNDDKKIVYDAEILVDELGNEVIYTDNINSFVNNLYFNHIDFGKHILQISNVYEIFNQLRNSKKRSVNRLFADYIENIPEYSQILNLESSIKEKTQKNLDISKLNLQLSILTSNEGLNTTILAKINDHLNLRDKNLAKLNLELERGEVNEDNYSGMFRQMIVASVESHTSFIKSLDYIASRTPAQSHLSFMPMKLVAFDESGKNSAYVSRYQLYLQGSDFDVDKASLLGSIIRNGIYVKWSPFMNLSSIEALRASEKLPFPTGKILEDSDNLLERIYDKMDKPIHLIWNDDTRITFILPNFNLDIHLFKNVKGIWVSDLTKEMMDQMTPMEAYLIERAITDKIPEGELFDAYFNIMHLGFNENRVKDSSLYDYNYDFTQFARIFKDIWEKRDNGQFYFDTSHINILNIEKLSILINALNSFGKVYKVDKEDIIGVIKRTVDTHNTFFNDRDSSDGKDAVVNYISSNMFQISSDPVNLVEAMTSVDLLTEYIKEIAKQSPLAELSKHFDKGNVMSLYRLLRLTLSGKQNTGIEASSLKVMEAINQYLDVILNYGSDEELKSLITPIEIGGYRIGLICNAYCKNIANIKSKEVYDALLEVNNDEDLALWLSAFLSLSTDNAKDPTLSKINANPEMIGLYNAGFVLGLPIDFLSKVIMSPTGMTIAEIQLGNVFLGYSSLRNINNVIKYIKGGPRLNLNPTTIEIFLKAILAYAGEVEVNAFNLTKLLMPKYWDLSLLLIAKRIINLAKSLAYGKDGEEIKYNLPSVKSRLSKDIQITKSRISGMLKSILALEQLIAEKESLNKKHLRLDKNLTKLTTSLVELQERLNSLQEIRNEYEVSQTIPLGEEGSVLEEYRQYLENLESLESGELSEILRKTFEDYKDYIKESYNFKKAVLDLEDWINVLELTQLDEGYTDSEGKRHNTLTTLSLLNEFASEMSLIRPNLSLNQQLPNSKENLLAFIKKFENIINDRLAFVENKDVEEIETFRNINASRNINGLNISISEFVWDEDYRKAAIKAYDSIKYKVNTLDVLVKVKHYFGYLKACDALYESLKYQTVQYRELDRIIEKVIIGDLGIRASKDILARAKIASRYISRLINNMFMLNKNVELSIPKITDGKVDSSTKVPIKLGTKEGNEAFKQWMDLVIIPKFKRLYKSNKFAKELSEATYHKSDNHNTIINYTTGIDTMTSNPTEVTKFAEVTEDFNKLVSVKMDGIPLVDAFFYYDLIAYDRLPGQQSLTPIFNKLVALGNTQVILDYTEFVSDLDLGGNYILTLDESQIDEIKRFIAPVISIYALDDFNEEYGWVKDPLDLQYYLIKRKPKQRGGYNEEIETMDDPILDDMMLESLGLGPDGDVNPEEGYTPITLESKLNKDKYEIISNSENLNSPYMNSFLNTETQSALEGQVIISPKEIRLGNETIILKDGELDISEKVKERLKKITGLKNIDDLIVTKIVINGYSLDTVIDVDTTKDNLENPCKQ